MLKGRDLITKQHIAIRGDLDWAVLSGVLAMGTVTVSDTCPTACTDGVNVIYGAQFMEKTLTTDEQRRYVVIHEALHRLGMHMWLWRSLFREDPRLANIAADYWVNGVIEDTDKGRGFVERPPVGIVPEDRFRHMSIKQIFDILKQEQKQDESDEQGDDQERGDGQPGDKGEPMDQHEWGKEPATEQEKAEREQQVERVKRALEEGKLHQQRVRSAKGAGGSSASIADVFTPAADWRALLEAFLTETCKGNEESSWARPNRRFIADDIYMPSLTGNKMGELVVGIDTSGSCWGTSTMRTFISHLTRIIEQVSPTRTHVVYWDTRVAGHQVFDEGQFAVQNIKVSGGGGTRGDVLFDYLREKRIQPAAIVQLTDGEVGNWGRSDTPTLWAISGRARAPFGTTIHIEE